MSDTPTDAADSQRRTRRALLFVAGCLSWSMSYADPGQSSRDEPALQNEADYRVIAARCGTPAFEKQFSKQSRAAVAAGLIVRNQESASIEKAIEARRRNPLLLVSTKADCVEKMSLLKAVQQQRAQAVRTGLRQVQK
ncbi:hypothetical protein [Variovorax sp. RCC_210]|uniref:hypothetical protein n=1 Tax=Variovorax sp. RCC_210 TaxID=3239217 RepID=UPI003523434B